MFDYEKEELLRLMSEEMLEAVRDLYFQQGMAQMQIRQEMIYQQQLNQLWETNPALAAYVEQTRARAEQRRAQGFQDAMGGYDKQTGKQNDWV
ncbi:MAG: hypothetical protein KME30_24940 [Iphinoe sp. HA4291-MV1]|jgi:Tfp pilus assembly protein PilW|nr:hypothetical protein [Iphinoe sp. HA4291-MV1]